MKFQEKMEFTFPLYEHRSEKWASPDGKSTGERTWRVKVGEQTVEAIVTIDVRELAAECVGRAFRSKVGLSKQSHGRIVAKIVRRGLVRKTLEEGARE